MCITLNLIVKALATKVQNILIYIGYAAGMLLLLENMAKIVKTGTETGIRILLFSTFFWLMSFLSRKFVFDNHVYKMRFAQKLRLELLYFVFCHFFVLLFVTTALKYTPFGNRLIMSPVQSYSYFLNYFSNDLIFSLLVNALGLFLFMWFLLGSSHYIYRYAVQTDKYYAHNAPKRQFMQSAIFAIILAVSLGLLNLPPVGQAVTAINNSASAYLRVNFKWVVDYILSSPIVYYAYASLRGSELVEHFSLYRKIV